VGDSIDECAGLAGSGAGDDEKRSIPMNRRGSLLRVELSCEVALRPGVYDSLSGGINPGLGAFGHRF
jgi:hypothetical protein